MPRIVQKVLQIEQATVTDIDFETDDRGPIVVVSVVVHRRARSRCPHCGVRGIGYDRTAHLRRWRHTDWASMRCYLQAPAPRIACTVHGVVTAAVPWSRHPGAKCTSALEYTAAWLTAHAAISVVMVMLRLSFRTITALVERVVAEHTGRTDRLAGVSRIGIDEIAYRKGHKYLTVVVDHDTGRLIWAQPGRNKATLEEFFDVSGHVIPPL